MSYDTLGYVVLTSIIVMILVIATRRSICRVLFLSKSQAVPAGFQVRPEKRTFVRKALNCASKVAKFLSDKIVPVLIWIAISAGIILAIWTFIGLWKSAPIELFRH